MCRGWLVMFLIVMSSVWVSLGEFRVLMSMMLFGLMMMLVLEMKL